MPKPNQTMLDQLVKTFKSTGNTAPFREMKLHGEFTDPMIKARANQQLAGNKLIKVDPSWRTPERVKYQRGIEARLYPKKVAADELVDEMMSDRQMIQDEWEDAVSDAKESLRDDWEAAMDNQTFDDIDPYYLEFEAPTTDLRSYWPAYARRPEEISKAFESAQDAYYDAKDARKRIYSTRGIMDEQMLTPRYRNYQRAMRQRQENAEMGRLNAAIMNLYRRGYSMPEIREILRNQRVR